MYAFQKLSWPLALSATSSSAIAMYSDRSSVMTSAPNSWWIGPSREGSSEAADDTHRGEPPHPSDSRSR